LLLGLIFGVNWASVSRSSLLTGRRPDTTKVLNNGLCPFTIDPEHKNWVSLPQYPLRGTLMPYALKTLPFTPV